MKKVFSSRNGYGSWRNCKALMPQTPSPMYRLVIGLMTL